MSLTNNYATDGGSSTTDSNGKGITQSLYQNPDFWFNNAGGSLSQVYLNYDTDIWEWDSIAKLPKLKKFKLPEISTLARTSASPAPRGSTVTVTATLANTPATDTGTVTFYTSETPSDPASWTSVGSKSIADQSTGTVTHSFTGSATPGTYFIKAILNDTTRSTTYDSYTDGGITDVSVTLIYIPEVTAITMDPESILTGAEITATAAIIRAPATDRGEIIFQVTTTPANGNSWRTVGNKELSAQVASTLSASWTAEYANTTYYVKAILRDATQGTNFDSYTDGGLTSVTYQVTGEPTPSVLQAIPAELRLCDENNRQSTVITQYDSFTYTEVWGAADSFELTMSRKANHADELLAGRIIMVPADQTHDYYRVLIIRQIRVDEDRVKATGTDYLWDLFSARIILDATSIGTGTDTQEGVAETVARHYINVNCLQATDENRRDPFTVMEPVRTSPLGGTVKIEGRFQTLSSIIESVCTQGDLNIYGALIEDDTRERGWYIEARFAVGTDHSQDDENPNTWVVLSEEYGNAVMTEYIDNVPTVNLAIVYGSGTGTERIHKDVGATEAFGAARRETFIDARDCTDNDSMTARGNEALKDAVKRSVELKLVNDRMYGRDFTIGDTVTCDLDIYGSYHLQVTEVETEYTPESTQMSVVLGAEISGVMTVLRSAIESIPLRRQ